MTAHADSHITGSPFRMLNTWSGGSWADLKTAALTPILMPLEQQAAKVNTQAAFKQWKGFAQGRGKITKGLDAGLRVGMLSLWRGVSRKKRQQMKLCVLDRVFCIARDLQRRREGRTGIPVQRGDKTVKGKRETRRFVERERFEERLRGIAPAQVKEDNLYGFNEDRLNFLKMALEAMIIYPYPRPKAWGKIPFVGFEEFAELLDANPENLRNAMALAILLNKRKALSRLFKVLRLRFFPFAFAALLKHLEAEAFRAHLAKRVKPVSRRTRVRRPLYARPRPPSCPLAPPVI